MLFKHFCQQYWNRFSFVNHVSIIITSSNITLSLITSINVIRFTIISNQFKNNVDYVFRNWYYVIVKLKLTKNTIISKSIIEKQKICFDFECLVTLTNRAFMKNQLDDDIKIQQLILSLLVREIENKLIKINDFVVIQLYIDDVDTIK